MGNRCREGCVAGLVLALFSSAGAATDGKLGMTSEVAVPVNMSASEAVQISGLQDVDFGNISPAQEMPITESVTGVCLYSSTGLASVSATALNGTTNLAKHTADLISETDVHAVFSLKLGDVPLFVSPGTVTLTADSDSQTCSGGVVGSYTLKVILLSNPIIAGSYKATVTVTVSAA